MAARLDAFFGRMADIGASDLHMTSGSPVYVRVHGEMKHHERWPGPGSGEKGYLRRTA